MANIMVIGSLAESLINFRGPFLRALVERGHSVTGVAPSAPANVVRGLADMGVGYESIPLDRTGLGPFRDARTFFALLALFRKRKPDVVFGYTIKPVLYGSLAARLAGVPRIYSMITGLGHVFASGGLMHGILRGGVSALYRACLRGNDRVFFQNPDDRDLFVRRGLLRDAGKAVVVNGSGIDIEAFRPAPFPSTVSFLLIARLIRDKGVTEYVEAARELRRRHAGAAFRLVGWIDRTPGAIREEELRAWSEEGVIEYLGRLEDVRPAIASSSVYVLPSSYGEGTPRTVLEAMAMGRPVITTDTPGCRETVEENRNGFLVPVRDVPALVAAMARFIEQPALIETMGQESRRIAVEKYDVRKVNAVILTAMDALVSNGADAV